jgi:hypothetical protein
MKYIKTFEDNNITDVEWTNNMKGIIEGSLSVIKVVIKKLLLKHNINWYEFDKEIRLYRGNDKIGVFDFNNYNYTLYMSPGDFFKHDMTYDDWTIDIPLKINNDEDKKSIRRRVASLVAELEEKGFMQRNTKYRSGYRLHVYYYIGKVFAMNRNIAKQINQ